MKASSGVYLTRLDHLRFAAAAMVFAWHFMHSGAPNAYVGFEHVPAFPLLSLLEEGHTGVSLFMVLSGFIFMRLAVGQTIAFLPFYGNRLLRILPLFAIWCLFYVQSQNLDPVEVLVSTLFLLNRGAVPGIGWTVIVEFQFYLVFPFLALFAQRRGSAYLLQLIALAILFRFLVWLHNGSIQHLSYWTIFGRIDEFLWGMLAASWHARFPRPARWMSWGVLVFGLLIVVLGIHGLNLQGGFYHDGAYPSPSALWIFLPSLEGFGFALVILGYLTASIPMFPMLDRALAQCGAASYSIYWNHMFLIEIAGVWFAKQGVVISGMPRALLWGGGLVFPLCVTFALLTYHLIERPFLSLRRPYLFPVS